MECLTFEHIKMDKSLNKYISETGFCSRREADKYIDQGRVTINDQVAIKGNRVLPEDTVSIQVTTRSDN